VSVDVVITEDLERELRAVIDAASGGLIEPLWAGLEGVARDAASAWYTQVDRESGRAGHIVTELVIGQGVSVLSVGSTLLDAAATGAPVAAIVKRPGPASKVRVTRPRGSPLGAGEKVAYHKGDLVVVEVPNPKASQDRGSLLTGLVVAPGRAVLDRLIEDGTIGRAIQRRIDQGGG